MCVWSPRTKVKNCAREWVPGCTCKVWRNDVAMGSGFTISWPSLCTCQLIPLHHCLTWGVCRQKEVPNKGRSASVYKKKHTPKKCVRVILLWKVTWDHFILEKLCGQVDVVLCKNRTLVCEDGRKEGRKDDEDEVSVLLTWCTYVLKELKLYSSNSMSKKKRPY